MTIDVKYEKLIIFTEAARLIPGRRNGRPTHPSTLWRWHRKGVLVGGRRIYLDAVRLPSGAATTVGAVAKFIAALNSNDSTTHTSKEDCQPDLLAAVQTLDADGI